jgi:hypothetical protein
LPIADQSKSTGLFRDEQIAVRQEGEAPWVYQIAGNGGDSDLSTLNL